MDLYSDVRVEFSPPPLERAARRRPVSAHAAGRKGESAWLPSGPPRALLAGGRGAAGISLGASTGYAPRRSDAPPADDHVLEEPGEGTNPRASFGAWQGRKFALPRGASVGAAGFEWALEPGARDALAVRGARVPGTQRAARLGDWGGVEAAAWVGIDARAGEADVVSTSRKAAPPEAAVPEPPHHAPHRVAQRQVGHAGAQRVLI